MRESFSVPIAELAAELGAHRSALQRQAARLGIPMRKRRRHPVRQCLCWCIRPSDAAKLRATRQEKCCHASEVSDWLTAEEAAQLLGFSVENFHAWCYHEKLEIQRVFLTGNVGRQVRYNPDDVQREVARLRMHRRIAPRGAVSDTELPAVCGVTRRTFAEWRKEGCPHIRLLSGRIYYFPDKVLGWLSTQTQRSATRAAAHHCLSTWLSRPQPSAA